MPPHIAPPAPRKRKDQSSTDLYTWLTEALASPVASFAKGIVADRAAVAAAIALPWSNGQTEGQICRLKRIRRQMSGRGDLDLLRARLMAVS